jgi:hypothetical protein
MTTTTASAATTFIDIGERTNVTSGRVMLGLGPSIHSAAWERSGAGGSGAAKFGAVALVAAWVLGTSPRMTMGVALV